MVCWLERTPFQEKRRFKSNGEPEAWSSESFGKTLRGLRRRGRVEGRSCFGVVVFLFGVIQAYARKIPAGNDPWGQSQPTLEWTLSSPPPSAPREASMIAAPPASIAMPAIAPIIDANVPPRIVGRAATSTATPAFRKIFKPFPACCGFGSVVATTTRRIPAARIASVQGGVRPCVQHGSKVT